jgi:hypothetical protein
MVPDCSCKTIIRDYGMFPIYWWPVKVRRKKDGSWRGGWTTALHGYICGKHFKEYLLNSRQFEYKYGRDEKRLIELVKTNVPRSTVPL